MYIETSSPRAFDSSAKARLEFSVPSADTGKVSCLAFYYHMYGATINTLNVISGQETVFTLSGNQGDQWKKVQITMTLPKRNVSCI